MKPFQDKHPASIWQVPIAIGFTLILGAGLQWFQQYKEGTCIERGVDCGGMRWQMLFFIGSGIVVAGIVERITSRRQARSREDPRAG